MQPSLGEWTAVAFGSSVRYQGRDGEGEGVLQKAGGKLGAGDTARAD